MRHLKPSTSSTKSKGLLHKIAFCSWKCLGGACNLVTVKDYVREPEMLLLHSNAFFTLKKKPEVW